MNGLLLNEHRVFNNFAKEYAVRHLSRDYEAIRPTIQQFMQVMNICSNLISQNF